MRMPSAAYNIFKTLKMNFQERTPGRCLSVYLESVLASQSSPSNSPSPLIAEVLKMAHCRFLMLHATTKTPPLAVTLRSFDLSGGGGVEREYNQDVGAKVWSWP
jgi:hypothetical protein